jgi:hypothetical protein
LKSGQFGFTAPGAGQALPVEEFHTPDSALLDQFFAFGPETTNGVMIGGA